MSEATRRLSLACKLQPNPGAGTDNENSNNGNNGSDGGSNSFDEKNLVGKDKRLYEQRKKSVGSEMVGVLQVLGKVSDE